MRAYTILLLLLLTACSSPETVTIGGAFGLTGDAAEWGQDELRAAQLAIEEANAEGGIDGKQIVLIAEDTKSSAKDTLSAVQKLIAVDGVPVIIGPTWGDSFGAVIGPLGEEAQVVQITPSGALEVAEANASYGHYFSTWYPQQPEAERHMRFLAERGYDSVVVIHDEDPFNTVFAQIYIAQAQQHGIQVQEELSIPLGTRDFRTILLRANEHGPDVVFVSIFDVAELGNIIKTMQELGMDAKLMSTASAQTNALIDSYASYAEGNIYYTFPDTGSERYREFEERFSARHGAPPTAASAGPAYDATRAAIAALRSGASSGTEVRDALAGLAIDGTIVGTLSFNEAGQIATAPFVVKTVANGTFAVVG